MLRFIVVLVFTVVFFKVIYKWLKKQHEYFESNFSENNLVTRSEKIENEKRVLDEKLKEAEEEVKEKQKEIEKIKSKGEK